ncbi:hypothetical protein CEXT_557491 [Caerostris extrusa]|uniref:Uncharacterized protein n=1 Tax=Caerostris extrusa TaxID=172846 RepID=A0AAV4T797_CAEEX|nr:hypothetical protein CEXT_557491 [Caerostris extrusa]
MFLFSRRVSANCFCLLVIINSKIFGFQALSLSFPTKSAILFGCHQRLIHRLGDALNIDIDVLSATIALEITEGAVTVWHPEFYN